MNEEEAYLLEAYTKTNAKYFFNEFYNSGSNTTVIDLPVNEVPLDQIKVRLNINSFTQDGNIVLSLKTWNSIGVNPKYLLHNKNFTPPEIKNQEHYYEEFTLSLIHISEPTRPY